MKKIVSRRTEDVVLRCNSCDKWIGKMMWRAYLESVVIEDGNEESLDFCSQKCCKHWVKANISFEKIKSEQVMKYKKDIEGVEETWED